ncbi:MAG TPA: hypothetical protein VF432_00440 [Thermoanaerobaculia bacterium]
MLLFAACAGGAFADDALRVSGLLEEDFGNGSPSAEDAVPSAAEELPATPGILLYKLPGSAVKPGPAETEVVLAVEIDKAVVATQTVQVPPEDPSRDRLIEVLAGQPAAVADIERRLRDGARDAAVVVRVDGKQYQRLSWKELVAASAAFTATEPVSPQQQAVTSSLMTPQQQCYQSCNDEYDLCERTCEPYSGPNACWDCRTRLDACANFCASCPRKWKTYGSWSRGSRTETGLVLCLADEAARVVRYHKEWQQQYSRPVTEFTENCDHSITKVTTYEYRYDTCWTQLPYSCNRPDGYIGGTRKKCQ